MNRCVYLDLLLADTWAIMLASIYHEMMVRLQEHWRKELEDIAVLDNFQVALPALDCISLFLFSQEREVYL